jgi:hypothetical protein
MCTVSMIMDHGRHEFWPHREPLLPKPWFEPFPGIPMKPLPGLPPIDPSVPEDSLKDFLKLFEAAKKYDETSGQPDCEDPEKIKVLEAVQKRLAEIRKENGVTDAGEQDHGVVHLMLYGSSNLPGLVTILGKQVQLGEIVRRAFADSKLTVEAWNAEDETKREHRLVDAIAAMRKEPTPPRVLKVGGGK